MKLRKNIFDTPALMRQVLGHPLLPDEALDKNRDKYQQVDFRLVKQQNAYPQKILNRFSLKYLAKFINEHDL